MMPAEDDRRPSREYTRPAYCTEEDVLGVCDQIFRPSRGSGSKEGEGGALELEFCLTDGAVRDHLPPTVAGYTRSMTETQFHTLTLDAKNASGANDDERRIGYTPDVSVLLYGVQRDGASVLAVVNGFRPSLRFLLDGQAWTAARLRSRLTDHPDDDVAHGERRNGVSVNDVTLEEQQLHKLCGGYSEKRYQVARLTFRTLRDYYATIRNFRLLNHGGNVTLEAKIDPYTQFVGATGIRPCSWIRVRRSDAMLSSTHRLSHSALEFRCNVESLHPMLDAAGQPVVRSGTRRPTTSTES